MDFSTPERNTMIAAPNLLLAADDTTKGEAALSGALTTPEKIRTLIERIEQEGQR